MDTGSEYIYHGAVIVARDSLLLLLAGSRVCSRILGWACPPRYAESEQILTKGQPADKGSNMTRVRNRSTRLRIGLILAVVLSIGAAVMAADTRTPAVKAREWAATVAVSGRLPVTLSEFVALPLEYRVAAKSLMTPAEISALWRGWLTQFAARPDLSGEQRAFVHKLRALAVPDLYNLNSPIREDLKAELATLCARKAELFDAEQRRALSQVGPLTGPSAEGGLVRVARLIESLFGSAVLSAGIEDCTCHGELTPECGDCEDEELKCKDKICTPVHFDCGCMDEETCTDLCEPPIE
jgi:hypothetical protein